MTTRRPARHGDAVYFESAKAFGAWLARHHATAPELLVGFHKRDSGRTTLTWPESVEQALRFGWIDGVRRSVDATRYTIRFTPRRRGSIWSAKNIATATALVASGQMERAGLAAFQARSEEKSRIYSFERAEAATLAPEDEARLKANAAAWAYFQKCPPSYRRAAYHWIISAKRPETRARRLDELIADSAHGRDVKPLRRYPTAGKKR